MFTKINTGSVKDSAKFKIVQNAVLLKKRLNLLDSDVAFYGGPNAPNGKNLYWKPNKHSRDAKRIAKRTEAYVDNFKDLDDNKEIR